MSYICLECGATHLEGNTCQSIFDSFLALEFTDPGYGAVHMLTVACFMIQHGRYSAVALGWIKQQLHAYLGEDVPVSQIRRSARQETQQAARNWKVLRQPDEPPMPQVAWSMTIADVAAHSHDAANYCEWIRRWARVTLQEMPAK
jgi:hypothetical protein